MNINKGIVLLCALALAACGRHDDYDISRGIDKEMRLFSEEVSLPLADIGPVTLGMLLGPEVSGGLLQDILQEDEEGYFVVEKKGSVFNTISFMMYMKFPDQSAAVSAPMDDFSEDLGSSASSLEVMGFRLSPQEFTLSADNPLTEGIDLSGRLTLSSGSDEGSPAETIASEEFSKVKVEASASSAAVLKVEKPSAKAFHGCTVDNLVLDLPQAFLAKDPTGGMGLFSLSYHYKSYIYLNEDFPAAIPIEINDIDLELGKYLVKEATICAEASNEVPLALELEKVVFIVTETGEDGSSYSADWEGVETTMEMKAAAGSPGKPSVSPLRIGIKATDGTIPDISGLRLYLRFLAPQGVEDKRLGNNQELYFKNIRATISGGITLREQ